MSRKHHQVEEGSFDAHQADWVSRESHPVTSPSTDLKTHGTDKGWGNTAVYILLLVAGAGVAFAGDRLLNPSEIPVQPPLAPAFHPLQGWIDSDSNAIAVAVEKVGPAVVRIDATRTVASRERDFTFNPLFDEFFQPPERSQIEQGVGSGFIMESQGIILTNAHVISGADRVSVTLKDGREFAGEVLGEDPLTDVAVVKIPAANLPTVTLGDSMSVKPGEWAIAIGNPLGLDNTVTAGIISATGRSSSDVGVPDKRVGFLQTDAAINPGNSGGPLLNQSGEVIGMNTAIIGGAQGLGFAIPIHTASAIAQQLIATGKAEHPYLGIRMVTLSPAMRAKINRDRPQGLTVSTDKGVLIVGVTPNAPAAKAGLQVGDIIQAIDGQPMTSFDGVQRAIEAQSVGSQLRFEILRQNRTLSLVVELGSLPSQN
ncbi:MAG: trypsin-like peptidase domain-containing protein [Desertifilum sp.]|nr:trypsin-like peptidase domain-containing protein [Desertifilum sp.]